jgi:peroxiredoxin
MFKRLAGAVIIGLLAATLAMGAAAAGGQQTQAPLFTAKASFAGKSFLFSLKHALAKGPVVLYFYPAAFTRGCDLEAHTFAANKAAFQKADATIIGVSADSIERLNQFSADPDYCASKFPVASDPDGKIAKLYGLRVIPPKKGVTDVNGDPVTHGFFPRTTFVIDRSGTIVATLSSKRDGLTPDEHVKRSLAVIKRLRTRQSQ